MVLFDALEDVADTAANGSFVFANFVEFDSLYGHPRDVAGYARALEVFDKRVGALLPKLREDDLILFTADHGNDPTWVGNDHTRERVPVVGYMQGHPMRGIGHCGFSDVGETIAKHLGIAKGLHGDSFL